MKHIAVALAALVVAACAQPTQTAQPIARYASADPESFKRDCGAPGTTPGRECLLYFFAYGAGYESHKAITQKPERKSADFCITGTSDTLAQQIDKFRAALAQPGSADEIAKAMPAEFSSYGTAIAVQLAMARAYPCK